MRLHHYTVTQLRLGATCPRVHYFDAERARDKPGSKRRMTLLWKQGGVPAGGALFHRSIEKFTRLAARAPEVLAALQSVAVPSELHEALARYFWQECLPPATLASKPVELHRGLVAALHAYLEELAHVAWYARSSGVRPQEIVEQLFGDPRKRVDVTFEVQEGQSVRVTGAIDYVFFDWRTQRHRIFDYKLLPTESPHGDLVQVAAYALMHHRQHGTQPDVAVYYLHPKRQMVERRWEQVWDERSKIYDYLASMVAWESYDERAGTGLRPPGVTAPCGGCRWRRECEPRLGPRSEGQYTSAFERGERREPAVLVNKPPQSLPEPEITEDTAEIEPPQGLWVGGSSRVPTRVLNTHVAVVGAAGSGKTWTAKILAEEAIRNGVPVLALDPQGDLVQFLRPRPRDQIPAELLGAYDEFHARVETRIFTPASSHAQRLSLHPIRLPKAQELAGLENPERRAEEEASMMEAVAVNLASLAGLGGDRRPQETFLLQILRGLAHRPTLALADVARCVREPELAGIEEPDTFIKDATRKNLELALNALVHGPAAALFTGGIPLDIESMLRPTREGRVPLNVIYLNALQNDAQKHFFVASLAAEIYRWMMTRASAEAGRTNLLLYLDEARDYIPAGGSEPMAKQPLLRLFRQGRKYGVGCLICTQSPRSVDYNAFGNCSSKVIGRLESAQDVERVKEWFTTEAPPAWLAGRKGAEPGSFVARWATEGADGVPFVGRTLFSAHEGAWSPDRVEREVRGS
jgi:hypothetical protein